MANFCLITPEMQLICVPMYMYWVKIRVLPFRNAMDYWNADGRINNGDD